MLQAAEGESQLIVKIESCANGQNLCNRFAREMYKSLVKRLYVLVRRRQKSRHRIWLQRWEAACNKLWTRFARMPVREESLQWFEKNHGRLCRLSAKKFKLTFTTEKEHGRKNLSAA